MLTHAYMQAITMMGWKITEVEYMYMWKSYWSVKYGGERKC